MNLDIELILVGVRLFSMLIFNTFKISLPLKCEILIFEVGDGAI